MTMHGTMNTKKNIQCLVLDQIILHNNRCESLTFLEYLTYLSLIL